MTEQPRTERRLRSRVVTAFVVALLGWGFLAIADEVSEGETRSFDETLLLALRAPGDLADPIGPIWVEEGARDVTALGSMAILSLVFLAAVGFLLLTGKIRAAGLITAATASGALASFFLKDLYGRPRPDLVPHGMETLTLSFPSGHAFLAALVYLGLGALLASAQPQGRVKTFVVALSISVAVLVGLTRVYLGVHWPTDVLAGWCAGAAWASAWWLVAVWTLPRRERERSVA